MLLAIDTSNDFAGVALRNEQGIRAEATWYAGRQHTEQILPQIDLMLHHLDLTPAALTVVAVAIGPGSWSGLRAGISLAKALVLAHAIPIIKIPTLDALAYGHLGLGDLVTATIRLGRDRYAAAMYRIDGAAPHRITDYQTATGSELRADQQSPDIIGDLAYDAGVGRSSSSAHMRRASGVADLAWARHLQRDYDDVVALEPIYLSHPVR